MIYRCNNSISRDTTFTVHVFAIVSTDVPFMLAPYSAGILSLPFVTPSLINKSKVLVGLMHWPPWARMFTPMQYRGAKIRFYFCVANASERHVIFWAAHCSYASRKL